jgi:xanthine/uracil permease
MTTAAIVAVRVVMSVCVMRVVIVMMVMRMHVFVRVVVLVGVAGGCAGSLPAGNHGLDLHV